MASYNAPCPRLWGNPAVGGAGGDPKCDLPVGSSLQPCQGGNPVLKLAVRDVLAGWMRSDFRHHDSCSDL